MNVPEVPKVSIVSGKDARPAPGINTNTGIEYTASLAPRLEEDDVFMQRVASRYDDLIAYPEGGLSYSEDKMTPMEYYYCIKHHADALEHNMKILHIAAPPLLTEVQALSYAEMCGIAEQHSLRWRDIGDVLIDLGFDYFEDAGFGSSDHSPSGSEVRE